MTLRRLGPWLVLLLVVVLVLGAVRWFRGAEDRRVAEACEQWLDHHGSVEGALSQTREALGWARHEKADLRASFVALEQVLADLDRWVAVATEAAEPLEGDISSGDASTLLFSAEEARTLAEALREGQTSDVRRSLRNLEVLLEHLVVQCALAWRAT